MKVKAFDLTRSFSKDEVAAAKQELKEDRAFQKELSKHGLTFDDVLRTTYPLKYLGIELADGGRPRFSLSDTLRIALHPRSMDGASKGLHLSKHRKKFIEQFPDVDALLSGRSLYRSAPLADLGSASRFKASKYAEQALPALARLQEYIALPTPIALEVLRKGLAAYKHSHRPGMTAHGWARARLSSFCMKGCTHYFPDHKLAATCPAKTHAFWARLPCICPKPSQCRHPGMRTAANSVVS